MTRLGTAVAAALYLFAQPAATEVRTEILSFDQLIGWSTDDLGAAFSAFLNTCSDMKDPEWAAVCEIAKQKPNPRLFFESFFLPVMMDEGEPALFTGYFEPELSGSLVKTSKYKYPLYAMPKDIDPKKTWVSRREIETTNIMKGRGLELAWVDDPVEAFFLQIQGSGRVKLTNGKMLRLGYAGSNGHPYKSVGRELVRRGIFTEHQVSADRISKWVRENGERGLALLRHNPSFVFFRKVNKVPATSGPLGAMNRSITTLRSIAVDPKYTKLGAPVWIEKQGRVPLNRLMIAQDTGSAIKGIQRADVFYGTGDDAGSEAGKIRDAGRMVRLLPVQMALDLVYGS